MVALAVMTVLFYVQQTFIFVGVKLTLAGRAGVLLNTQPIITAFMAHYFIRGDRLNPFKVAGLILAFVGVYLIFRGEIGGERGGSLLGDTLMLIAACCWATQTIILKRIVGEAEPALIFFYQALLASPLFFLTSLIAESPTLEMTPSFIVAAVYVILIGTALSFAWWNYLIKYNNPSRATSMCFVTPVASVLLSALILDEKISPAMAAATATVALGIFIANYSNSKK